MAHAIEVNESNLSMLGQALTAAGQTSPEAQKQAFTFLEQMRNVPGYSQLLLTFLRTPGIDVALAQRCATQFKNWARDHWQETQMSLELKRVAACDADRAFVKQNIVPLMLAFDSVPLVQAQLLTALDEIGKHDFPRKWPSLVGELLPNINPTNNSAPTILSILAHLCKRYRSLPDTNEYREETVMITSALQEPVLQMLLATVASLQDPATDAQLRLLHCRCARQVTKLLVSLSSFDICQYFADNLQQWMGAMHAILTLQAPSLASPPPNHPDSPSPLHKLQKAACATASLFASRYEEDFEPYLQQIVTDVWQLLVALPMATSADPLAIACISLLSSVAGGVHHRLFEDPNTLKQVCENVVVPNMYFRDHDEETFEMAGYDYVQREVEGNNDSTRRHSATQLVRNLRKNYDASVTNFCGSYVQTLLQRHATNPAAHWKDKNAALYLLTSVAVASATQSEGAIDTNPLVPVVPFFQSSVYPELQTPSSPVLLADAIKFCISFRRVLPREIGLQLLPLFAALAGHEHYVVHTFACVAVDRFLLVNETATQRRYTAADLAPLMTTLLTNLFKTLASAESKENEYVMRAVLRVALTMGVDIGPFLVTMVHHLSAIIGTVAKNPAAPNFNHYLWEALGALIKTGARSAEVIPKVEEHVLPVMQQILVADVTEFTQYVFQVFALLLEQSTTPVGQFYQAVFPSLMSPVLWERPSNVPALARLLCAYVAKGPQDGAAVLTAANVASIAAVAKGLIASPLHDQEGFLLYEAIVRYLPVAQFQAHMTEAFMAAFTRLTQRKTAAFIRSFLLFCSLFIGIHGPDAVIGMIDSVRAGIFEMCITSLWLKLVTSIAGATERKMAAIALVKLITESTVLWSTYSAQVAPLLGVTLNLIEGTDTATPVDPTLVEDESDVRGYHVLAHSLRDDQDPFASVPSSRQFAVQHLTQVAQTRPGQLGQLVAQLDPAAQQQYAQMFAAVGMPPAV